MGAAAPVRKWDTAVEDKRRRAIDDRPYMHAGGAVMEGEVFGTGNPSPTRRMGGARLDGEVTIPQSKIK